ncbi:HD domain-containing protein [Desulfoluna spongiiphila]|uniref:HD domain-containing protein n=1 Tax=Desulfoluna spongiiphila TaxID=419481 RepID=A0A1G5CTL1_9BACT|nr:HD domain-containing protein [Desulfoluna spongiiphila]SCY05714.1 HD domain-containing protein [Desulfoluna spongiiphila]VVS92401.1 hd/pdease domain [Desulfoluna spongiiphila]
MTVWNQDLILAAWNFASKAHNGQTMPGTDIAYINHIGTVSMEVMAAITSDPACTDNPNLAVLCALLHDTIEDTDISFETVVEGFGAEVAKGVQALSKDKGLPGKREQMADSLVRIRQQPKEVWMVKLADRITNLQAPPSHWNREKISFYRDEAKTILDALGPANATLAERLRNKIENYVQYC